MKQYIEKNEIAALFFLHYFKYTRFAFKQHKSEEDRASIHAHRTLMRLFGKLHNACEGRVMGNEVSDTIKHYIVSSENPYVRTYVEVMEDALGFLYDHVLNRPSGPGYFKRYA